jgi:hypothetical protein
MATCLDATVMGGVLSQRLVGLAFLVAVGLPSAVWACPYCAVRDDAGNAGVMLLGAMIALPFVIFITVVPVLRRAASENNGVAE